MRRLTLILSDLYLPEEVVRESFPAMLELPGLRWLLRFAHERRRIHDWRHWLAEELGASPFTHIPVAHAVALSARLASTGSWLATPVALEARLDHVRLRNRGLLQLQADQLQMLRAEFSTVFGDTLDLHGSSANSLLMTGGPDAQIHTLDPARLLDSDISEALPSGSPAASELRRLGTEIEMWLHGSQCNVARARAGQAGISALWLWGGGCTGESFVSGRVDCAQRLFGHDCFMQALSRQLAQIPVTDPPRAFAQLENGPPAYVEFAPMSGPHAESLSELEVNWFAPAMAALSAGELAELCLVANDRVFRVKARAGWKFWRPQRGWLESLA